MPKVIAEAFKEELKEGAPACYICAICCCLYRSP
jgi:hypothetical protein